MAEEFPEFSFKPAPLRGEQTWAIREGHVMRRGGTAMKLASVTSAKWGEMAYRGTRFAWLHLNTGDETLKIECNDAGAGGDRAAYLDLVVAVAKELEKTSPSLQVEVGTGGPARWAMFIILVFGVIVGGFFVLSGALDWVKRGHAYAIGLGGLAAVFCGWMAWVYLPWRAPQMLSAAELSAIVAHLRGA